MTVTKTIPWNTEDHLETPEDIAAYLEAVFEDGDPELIGYAGRGSPLKGHDGNRAPHWVGPAKPIQGPLARGSARI
jgi:hypothetical protein